MPYFPPGYYAPGFFPPGYFADPTGAPTTTLTPVTVIADGDTISQPSNTIRRYLITLLDPESRQPLSGLFDDVTGLRAFAWDGLQGPMLASPSVTWQSAGDAQVFLDVYPSDLATLPPQPYPLRVEVDRGGFWQEAWDGWLDVVPESAAGLVTYAPGTYAEMLDKGGAAVRQLLTADLGAGFLKPRAEAWLYVRGVILAHYRPPGGNRGGLYYTAGLPGWWIAPEFPNPVLAGYLDSGKLLMTGPVKEVLARKALAILYDRQLDPAWRSMAGAEHRRADLLLSTLVAGIDLIGNGFPSIVINCGIFHPRDI